MSDTISDTSVEEQTRPAERPRVIDLLTADGNVLQLFIIVILIFVGMSLLRPDRFPTFQNMRSMAFQSSEIGILTIAIAVTMLTAGIDLSINSTANLAGILAGLVLTHFVPADPTGMQVAMGVTAAIAVALGTGLIGGLFNGFLVAYIGITPILATLGTLTLYAGIATAITEGSTVFGIPAFQVIGNGTVVGIPIPLIILIAVAVVISILLNRTSFGLKVYMLGTNPTAARYSGIDNKRILLWTYIISGVLASIAGIVILGRTNSANVDFGGSYILLAILIAVLGGIDPYGGSGKVSGVVLAVIALQLLSTGLNMLLFRYSGSNFFKEFAWGALLLIVLVLNYYRQKRQARTPDQQKKQGVTSG